MKLTAFLLVAPALLAAALPAAFNPSDIELREASPEAEADPLYYIKRIGYNDKREASAEAEADPLFYIKRIGYNDKREASAEA
ncbi:hypothetical protein D0Z07_6266 [Hyphodiscus hymeniophilus]|uniref:Uncharacterized protein n=1 Tax=Hyphodiscus hymeniophilus TaxID=353542 RepID=A0A9P7AUX9_9HELO|nr:hypothetical protein D0Z07_6266 [Hyphodiscus hymeniophilus]